MSDPMTTPPLTDAELQEARKLTGIGLKSTRDLSDLARLVPRLLDALATAREERDAAVHAQKLSRDENNRRVDAAIAIQDDLRSSLATATARVAEVEAELARVAPVVEAAVARQRAWVAWGGDGAINPVGRSELAAQFNSAELRFLAAVDALAKGGGQ